MTTAAGAKDLATVEPRGLDAELEGYAWIPRMLDKARATLAQTNGSYLFGCPVDHTCMARLGVSPELVLELAGQYSGDSEWLSAMREHGIPPASEAWFDGQAVEDELQGPGWYLRVARLEAAPASDGGAAITAAPAAQTRPAVSATGEVFTVNEGEVTFFLGEHQARLVRAGETVWIPGAITWRLHNRGAKPAAMTRFAQS
jgi:mannose-6-phosphate isomerase-like protein (cupin superfamily)